MRRRRLWLGGLAAGLLLLGIPGPDGEVPPAPARGARFAWNRDAYWQQLEGQFIAARGAPCSTTGPQVEQDLLALEHALGDLGPTPVSPDAPILEALEHRFFGLAPRVAACGEGAARYAELQVQLRQVIKSHSTHWDMTTEAARSRIYRLLYGTRLALEEVVLHHPGQVPALLVGRQEPHPTPSVEVAGVRVHSGDILVSRGGYPTSALIARGSDFPGNFSHVALVHVDSASGVASVIEALIADGVSITTPEAYLADKKLRIMVLRLRADLPALVTDPMLPHRAATRMLERARRERIRYDFAMDYQNPDRLFCSEVASSTYAEDGVVLWTGLSTISAPGLRRWLAGFGVRHFETQEPSDIEYDPQLGVVAEWRAPDQLQADRIDNAVIDAMLEGADRGDVLGYPLLQLPLARLAKAWSWGLNLLGRAGPIPEGMSARSALRNRAFSERQTRLAAIVTDGAAAFQRERGYPPPYWVLVDLARDATQRPPGT